MNTGEKKITFPKVLISGMGLWHLGHTARELEKLGSLVGVWCGSRNNSSAISEYYRLIWPYFAAQRPFGLLSYRIALKSCDFHPFSNIEEAMRWHNLIFYDFWIRRQNLPPEVNVIQGPMGSCEPMFELAIKSRRNILKVFDATNSHPTTFLGYWQRECDIYSPGYRIPMSQSARSRVNRELEMADMILCPSLFVRDTMVQNGIPSEKCFISHFGVDTSVFKPRQVLPSEPVFICVGSLCLRKGHQYLFRAFEIVKRSLPNARLICVGGIRPDFLKEWKHWRGICEHHNYMDHSILASKLASATAFVFPSLEEGFARVLSEAMAVGLPIIATYESGASTIVRDGEEGMIVAARNVDALAACMIRAANKPDENLLMGSKSFSAGIQSNTWKDYADRIYREYIRRLNFK